MNHVNTTPSRIEQRLAWLLAATPPPTAGNNLSRSRAKVDFVYLTEDDQDRLDGIISG